MFLSIIVCLIFCTLYLISTTAYSKEIKFYRYTDESGGTVMNTHIPPEYIDDGYVILNKNGLVIEKVERALTTQERARNKSLADEKAAAQKLGLEEKNNRALLHKIFNSEADIIRRYQEKQSAIDNQIDVAQNIIQKLRHNKKQYIHQAAEIERQGLEIPVKVLSNIKFVETQVIEQSAFIEKKNSEKSKLLDEFNTTLKSYREH